MRSLERLTFPRSLSASRTVNQKLEAILREAVEAVKTALGDNLYACCLYGSAVRGNVIEGVSDINLLIVLNDSTPSAHEALGQALLKFPKVDPFILGRRGFERSARAFAPKFASIRRNYRVLAGADPLKDFQVDRALEKFLCEQTLRNLRLRLVYAFVTRRQQKGYDRFVVRNITALFVHCSEVLRIEGAEIPADFASRIPLLEQKFQVDGSVLRDLLALKKNPQRMSDAEALRWHERLLPALDRTLGWIEANWGEQTAST